jgi:hypothetical protein
MAEKRCDWAHVTDPETGRVLCAGALFGKDCQAE